MNDNMKIFKGILKIVISMILAAAILSVISFCYNRTSPHVASGNGETDFKWTSEALMTTMAEGFSYLQMDENGYNNQTALDKIDVLIMGSSHVEAMQVDSDENMTAYFNGISDYSAYNIGISGHDIYRCVDNVEEALETYKPEKYLVIETSTIEFDKDEMLAVLEGKPEKAGSADTGIKKYIQLIPCLKPILNNILLWKDAGKKSGKGEAGEFIEEADYHDVSYRFLNKVSESAAAANVTPILLYHPSENLDDDGTVSYNIDEKYLNNVSGICSELGIVFADMTQDFKELYRNQNVLAHGFTNTEIGKGHLNEYGHRAIAERLARIIGGKE